MSGKRDWQSTARGKKWIRNLESYSAFLAAHGRAPKRASDDPAEKLLGVWMDNQKTKLRQGLMSDDHVSMVDDVVPGWRERQRNREEWDVILERVVEFIEKNDSFPSESSILDDESFLAKWVYRQRIQRTAERDRKREEREVKLDRMIPGWRDSSLFDERKWERMMCLFEKHVADHGRLPNTSADETLLYRWRALQIDRMMDGKLEPRRLRVLNERIPGWSKRRRRLPQQKLR